VINLTKVLGSIPSFVFNNQHVIALPKKWKIDPNSPLSFEVKINNDNQLILEGPLVKSSKIHDSQVEGADNID